MFRRNNPDFRKTLLSRCDEIAQKAAERSQEHRSVAEKWGKTHIILGLSTILFSSISAIFAFSTLQTLVITSSLLSTILASCITFLNPSQREIKRRNYSSKFSSLVEDAKQTIILINSPSMTESSLIEQTQNLTTKF